MSDHCQSCMPEFHDLVGVTSEKDFDSGKAAIVLCEGCGIIQVDPDGYCLGDCLGDYFTKEPHICRWCLQWFSVEDAPDFDHELTFIRIFGGPCPFHVGFFRRWWRRIFS